MEKMVEIVDYLRAGYSLFWLQTDELRRAKRLLSSLLEKAERKDGGRYELIEWDCTMGLPPDQALGLLDKASPYTVLVLSNFGWFLNKPQLIQAVQNRVELWKSEGKAAVIISAKAEIPTELEKDTQLLEMPLPDDQEIISTMEFVSESTEGRVKVPEGEEMAKLVSAAKGLTALEVENALALSVIKSHGFNRDYLNAHKAMAIERKGIIEVVKTDLTFDDIKGYENIKDFVLPLRQGDLGVMVVGPPGCGKTLFAYCLAGQTGRLTLKLDVGRLFSKYQGETDQNIREIQSLLFAVGECILIIDEFEKQFAGASGDGSLDSGTTRRATGKWLEFLEAKNRPKDLYIVATANSFRGIPPEYLRAGRWDTAPFFIDLPNEEEKAQIWAYWAGKHSVKIDDLPNTDSWTGAEIEACCRIASRRKESVRQAARFVLPLAKTMSEEIDALRDWANGRAIPARRGTRCASSNLMPREGD